MGMGTNRWEWERMGLKKIFPLISNVYRTTVITTLRSKKSDAKIQITITTANLIRINYPLSSFNYRLSGTNVANFDKIHHMVSEQQLFKKGT